MALGTPTDGGAAYSATGGGGTNVTPAYPASIAADDVLVLIVGQKPSTANGGTVTTPSGWTLRDSLTAAGGYGTTLGADTGNTNLFIYTKDTVDGTETGNLTVTVGTNNICWGIIVRIPGGGGTSFSFGTADGSRTTAPTSGTAFTTLLTNGATAPNLQAGDIAIWAMCIPTDVLTNGFTAPTISSTGTTFGTPVELEEPDSGGGNDIGGYVAYASATSGSSTAAPTVGVTATGTVTNVRGPIALIRIRDTSQTLTPTLYTNSQTFYGPTVTVGAVTLTPALYTNNQTFYSPDVTQSGGAQDLQPSLYTNDQTFYAAAVTASNTLTPDLYTNTQTFYQPTVSSTYALTPGLYTNDQTFYGPVVTQSGGPQTLLPDLYTNTQTFFAPTVAATNTLAPQLYTNAQTFYDPTITTARELTPSLYINTQTFYTPTVTNGGATTQALTFEDYVDVGYVEPDYVTWVASFQGGNQFFSPTLLQEAQRGEGWIPQLKRKRRFSEERDEREQLRRLIEQAVDPVTETQAKVVTVKGEVAVVTESRAIALPVPPQFDAQAVAKMAVSVLEAAGIEAKRVRDAENRRRAMLALEAERVENERRLRKRRRDEEILLLMG